jgi:lipopolysaccharide/colanic/teichoic acid biosynthesis glycosyltransferase
LEIQVSPGFYEIMSTGARMTHRGYVPLLVVDRVRIIGLDALLKHTLDYGLLLTTLPLWLPLTCVFALVARLLSVGPVLDRPQVLGCQGQVFTTGVFHVDYGETQPSSLRGRANAAFRRFLYESGLNKLPQFFNVLLGQMSLVGPRPVNVDHTKTLKPWLPNLLTVKPGVTGPWVMAGKESLAEEMRADVYYIRNYTIWLDLQLLLKSFTRMVRRQRHRPATFGEEVGVLSDQGRRPVSEEQVLAEGRVE